MGVRSLEVALPPGTGGEIAAGVGWGSLLHIKLIKRVREWVLC